MDFKKAVIAMTGAALVFCGVNSASAESLSSLEAKWGKPVSVKALSNGVEKRVYGEKDAEVGYFYFLVKDGEVIDRGVTQSIDNNSEKANNPEISSLMGSHFKNNKTTIADLKAEFGEPVNTSRYDNGMERVVFGPKDAVAGYKYFVTMNGTVVDEGTTETLVKDNKEVNGPKVSPFMANWYKKHPKTVSFLNEKWGTPVSVKEYKNGMKKMVFGPKDAVTGYNFFIVKDGKVVDRGFTS